jgi:uncharacterized protein with HEPN domain
MLEHALYVTDCVRGVSNEQFQSDRMLQFAVVRALEVIGEAARAVPEDVRRLAPDIAWPQVMSMRNKLAHRYFGVDLGIVWETAVSDVPALIGQLTGLLEKMREP